MKTVNVDEVLRILYKYGQHIFVTDYETYREMQDEIANLKGIETEPCDECVSRKAVEDAIENMTVNGERLGYIVAYKILSDLPSVTPQRAGHCKECKYFEYDSMAKVDGIPLIVAHEICKKWGDGCKTKEDGYCFLFESKEKEDKE